MDLKLDYVLIVLLHFLKDTDSFGTCSKKGFHWTDGIHDRILNGNSFKNLTIPDPPQGCHFECTKYCICLSFNVCGNECQLNDDMIQDENRLEVKQGCSYYNQPRKEMPDFPSFCCAVSDPCLNGGTCSSPVGYDGKLRFSCKCLPGFCGNLCERVNCSCADFVSQSARPLSGEYEIFDKKGHLFKVFCDFDSEPDFVWTLLLSYSRDNAGILETAALYEDSPQNEDVLNWGRYRMSLSRMDIIREQSTHWRATCEYNVNGFDNEEYIRVNLTVVDMTVPSYSIPGDFASACTTVEYMNIMEKQCHDCNFAVYFRDGHPPCIDFRGSKLVSHCQFDLLAEQHYCGPIAARRFGCYTHAVGCFDPNSKCQKSGSSTTQHWFGKKII